MKNTNDLTPEERAAIEARRAYHREWSSKNKEKIKKYALNYWAKKAAEMYPASDNQGG